MHSALGACGRSLARAGIARAAASGHALRAPVSASALLSRRAMSTTTHPSLTPVSTTNAPAAVGPYSQAIKLGDLLFCSGAIGLDPAVGKLVPGGVEAEAKQAFKNLKAVIEAGGSEPGKVVKTTVFLANMDDFATVNAIYADFFGAHKPARSAVQVARLPLGAQFEIEAIVSLGN